MVQVTQVRKMLKYSPELECVICHQQEHPGSKTLLQPDLQVVDWRCQLTQVDLYNGHIMDAVVLHRNCLVGRNFL